jgi:hypothetical protein
LPNLNIHFILFQNLFDVFIFTGTLGIKFKSYNYELDLIMKSVAQSHIKSIMSVAIREMIIYLEKIVDLDFLELEVLESNYSAIKVYEELNFRITGAKEILKENKRMNVLKMSKNV